MKMRLLLLMVVVAGSLLAHADEITFTFINLSNATFSATASELVFGQAVNVLVTDNNSGKSMTLSALDSGNTGASHDFIPGPPLVADYRGSGTDSVLIAASGHTFLSGAMADSGRLEANWPNGAGAFLSRFHVSFVDPAILAELGSPTRVDPDGSVSLTLAQTTFDGVTLGATLGGGEVTITTTTPEPPSMLLGLGAALVTFAYWRRHARSC